jgi:flagellar biosynthesis regulator FlaF
MLHPKTKHFFLAKATQQMRESSINEGDRAMVNRITVTLEQAEYSALLKLAGEDLRGPADQLRHILRVELENRGLWPTNHPEQIRKEIKE